MSHPIHEAEAFWDGHHHITEDPNFWMAHPLCRRAINLRVSGDPDVWPLDALAKLSVVQHPFRRVLSLGCGTGSLERTAARLKMGLEIEGLDSSEASLAVAREKAREEGFDGITYRRGDLNDLRLPRQTYDLVIFHQSLHHVVSIEKLLARVGRSLTADGILALDEWTGPSRTEWDEGRLVELRRMYAELPEEWRKWPALRDPIEPDDPSEAVRSSAILPAVRRLFHVLVERPYGGHIVSILLWQMNLSAVPESELNRVVARWLAMEEDDLATKPEASYHTAVVARPRIGLDGIASRASVFLSPVSGASDGAAANARVTASTRDAGAGTCDTHDSETMGLFRRGQSEKDAPRRLHIGCGQQAIPGWINIDNQALPGVDRVLDIRRGLPYNGVSAIYAEHFLEHLGFEEGLGFLRDCRRALADFGVLRVSTPNLDWVYTTHYPSWPSGSGEERLRDCFNLNQAFHGWGHQFLYNRPTLEAALKAAGFADVVFQRYGESNIPDLNALERHETYLDTPELPHVLIAEASGEAREVPLPEEVLRTFRVVINAR